MLARAKLLPPLRKVSDAFEHAHATLSRQKKLLAFLVAPRVQAGFEQLRECGDVGHGVGAVAEERENMAGVESRSECLAVTVRVVWEPSPHR